MEDIIERITELLEITHSDQNLCRLTCKEEDLINNDEDDNEHDHNAENKSNKFHLQDEYEGGHGHEDDNHGGESSNLKSIFNNK